MRVMVLVKENEDSESGAIPDRESLAAMGGYNEELAQAGVLLVAEGLHPSSKGKRLRFGEGEPVVTSGPFPQTGELLAGFWIWRVDSMEDAVRWLKQAPFGGGVEIEIRPVFETEDFGAVFTPELKEQQGRVQEMAERNKAA